MRVFLTGGTGFIGRALVSALMGRGWAVTVLVRELEAKASAELRSTGATLARGDIVDRDSMRAAMNGADAVIHNAGWYELGVGGDAAERRMRAINVDGTRTTLTLAHELGVPRIVHVSSIVALGPTGDACRDESFSRTSPPLNAYEQTKTEAHEVALELAGRGAPVAIALPGSVVGAGDHANLGILQRMYVRGFAPPLTIGGRYCRAQVHVDDCAEGMALIAEKGTAGQSYLLTAGALSYDEIYAIWATTPGGMRPLAGMPRWMALASAALAEPVQRALRLPNLLSREAVRAAYCHYDYSGEKARRELGWAPGDLRTRWLETMAEERRRATAA